MRRPRDSKPVFAEDGSMNFFDPSPITPEEVTETDAVWEVMTWDYTS